MLSAAEQFPGALVPSDCGLRVTFDDTLKLAILLLNNSNVLEGSNNFGRLWLMRILDHNLARVGRWSAAANVILSKDPEFI